MPCHEADTVWIDCFNSEWYSTDVISGLLEMGKRVCIVSPELHQRMYIDLWSDLSRIPLDVSGQLYLCTDLYARAQEVLDVITD